MSASSAVVAEACDVLLWSTAPTLALFGRGAVTRSMLLTLVCDALAAACDSWLLFSHCSASATCSVFPFGACSWTTAWPICAAADAAVSASASFAWRTDSTGTPQTRFRFSASVWPDCVSARAICVFSRRWSVAVSLSAVAPVVVAVESVSSVTLASASAVTSFSWLTAPVSVAGSNVASASVASPEEAAVAAGATVAGDCLLQSHVQSQSHAHSQASCQSSFHVEPSAKIHVQFHVHVPYGAADEAAVVVGAADVVGVTPAFH